MEIGRERYAFMNAIKCGARTRQDSPCKAPAIKGKRRCRMHGGKGSGAPKGSQNALKHGFSTRDSIELRKSTRKNIIECRKFIDENR